MAIYGIQKSFKSLVQEFGGRFLIKHFLASLELYSADDYDEFLSLCETNPAAESLIIEQFWSHERGRENISENCCRTGVAIQT